MNTITRPELSTLSTPPPPKPSRWLPWLAPVLGLLIMYISFRWAIGAVVHSRPVVVVPDITGKPVAEALTLLSQGRLGLIKDGEQFDKRFPAGTIVRQNPVPGMSVREGHVVKIALSQGGETLFVPDLAGQPFRNAQTTLQNAGLGVGEVDRRPSMRFEKDQVMSTDPPAGAVTSKSALVSLVLSDGPPGSDVLLVPDFSGKSLAEAKSWAARNQIPVTTREESDITKRMGEIIMQAPTADTPIHPGDTLTLVVNTGMGSESGGGAHVRYEVPPGSRDRDVRVLLMDETGEREIYRKSHAPGSRIDVPVTSKGRAKARILLNGIMAEEQEIQP